MSEITCEVKVNNCCSGAENVNSRPDNGENGENDGLRRFPAKVITQFRELRY